MQSGARRRVVLYELNEVPWAVVDWYVERHPRSNLATLLDRGASSTTVLDETSDELQPWRTWPTVHTSLPTSEHGSFELGQDPETFRGEPLWEVAAQAGCRIGLFGPLQSWPPMSLTGGGFHIPDTFARTAATVPAALQGFQEFNLRLTSEQRPDAVAALPKELLPRLVVALLRHGLTARSAVRLAGQLLSERRDPLVRAQRSTMQALVSFDLFFTLLNRTNPDLAVFFTNHVAGMMHRFWGDALPGYAQAQNYPADARQAAFLDTAMRFTDEHLGRLRQRVDALGDTVLVVLSGMGQAPLDYSPPRPGYVIDDYQLLRTTLELPPFQPGLAMHPHVSLQFESADTAEQAERVLRSVHGEQITDLFGYFTRSGRTVSFITQGLTAHHGTGSPLAFTTADGSRRLTTPAELGVGVRSRLGGSNTGQHDPRGSLVAYGTGISPDRGRREVDVLDVAPSVLVNLLGVPPARSMQGQPSLWQDGRPAPG